ncbi:MAG: hypothetical protein MZV65_34460 [Chromatiales bacterium]|nr:hypothetical protein [Chromatiales bacterium]
MFAVDHAAAPGDVSGAPASVSRASSARSTNGRWSARWSRRARQLLAARSRRGRRRAREPCRGCDEVTVRRRGRTAVHVRFSEQQLRGALGRRRLAQCAAASRLTSTAQPGPAGLPLLAGPDRTARPQVLEHYRRAERDPGAGRRCRWRALTLDRRGTPGACELDNGLALDARPRRARGQGWRASSRAWPRTARRARPARRRRVDLRYTNGFAVEWSSRAGARAAARRSWRPDCNEG